MRSVCDVVTIDGPSGVGKSTVSRMLAEALGYLYLDTGAMYRAAALQAVRASIDLNDAPALASLCATLELDFRNESGTWRVYLGNEDVSAAVRTAGMDSASSRISTVGKVRAALTDLQRKIGRRAPLVAEGRDMGTVVFPRAYHKFFLVAPAETRATRRYLERLEKGEAVDLNDVTMEMNERDDRDSCRDLAPLKPADDAVIIETAELSPSEVVSLMLEHIRTQSNSGAPETIGSRD
jgi:CMP/dCMP kinase